MQTNKNSPFLNRFTTLHESKTTNFCQCCCFAGRIRSILEIFFGKLEEFRDERMLNNCWQQAIRGRHSAPPITPRRSDADSGFPSGGSADGFLSGIAQKETKRLVFFIVSVGLRIELKGLGCRIRSFRILAHNNKNKCAHVSKDKRARIN